jgi:hypothetical protein
MKPAPIHIRSNPRERAMFRRLAKLAGFTGPAGKGNISAHVRYLYSLEAKRLLSPGELLTMQE